MKCPKCGGEMEEGVIVDYDYYHNPNKGEWAKKITGFLGTNVQSSHTIASYRCKSCGYLESYAK